MCASLSVRLKKEAAGHSNNSLESGARLLAPFGSGAIQSTVLCFLRAHTFIRAPGESVAELDQEEINSRVDGKSVAVSQSHYTLSSCILGNSRICIAKV